MTKISEISQDSTDTSIYDDNEEKRVKKFAKHMLRSSLFIGSFQEKRFVAPLNAYRAVIKIDDSEEKLIENIKVVKRRCVDYFNKCTWIGITDPKTIGAPAGYNVWVTLDQEVFGSYWYKIKNVEFRVNEVCLKLEIVRPVSVSKPKENDGSVHVANEDFFQMIKKSMQTRLMYFFSEVFTTSNIKESIIFVFLLFSTLLTFLIHAVKYILEYFLKLMHESSGFVKACTPVMTALLQVVMNTINGFYSLIAILWRDRSRPKPAQNIYQLTYQDPNMGNYKSLTFYGNDQAYQQNYRRRVNFNNESGFKLAPLD